MRKKMNLLDVQKKKKKRKTKENSSNCKRSLTHILLTRESVGKKLVGVSPNIING